VFVVVHLVLMRGMDMLVRPVFARVVVVMHVGLHRMFMAVLVLMLVFVFMNVGVFMAVDRVAVPVLVFMKMFVLVVVDMAVFVVSFHCFLLLW